MKDHVLVDLGAPANVDGDFTGPEPETIDIPAAPEAGNVTPPTPAPQNDPHVLTADAQPETPVVEPVAAEAPVEEPVSDGLVEFIDEFQTVHRVPPETAAYLRFAQTQRQASPPPQPQYLPPQQPQYQAPEEADPAMQRFANLEKTVNSIQGLLNGAVEANTRTMRLSEGAAYLEQLKSELPVFKSRPRIFAAVKEELTEQLNNALQANPNVNPDQLRSAIFHDAVKRANKLVRLMTEEMRDTAQTITKTNKNALPPAAGKQPVNQPKPINYNDPEQVAEATYQAMVRSAARRGQPVRS